MYCNKCGKEIGTDVKFCKYCGEMQTARSYENINSNAKKSGFGKYIVIGIAVLLLSIGIVAATNFHECDWCGETYFGAGYFDSWSNSSIICEDCAKQYYQGLNYKQFKIR